MEESAAPADELPAEKLPETEDLGQPIKSDRWKAKWLTISRLGKSIRTWTLTFIVLFFGVVMLKLILKEINDKGYHIQAFRVPDQFVKDGYDGVTAAYMLLDRVNNIIVVGNEMRSIKEVEEYQQSAERIQVQVEVSGVGISPDAIASYIKQAIGVKSKTIGGEIVKQGDTLKCFLRMSGSPTEAFWEVIDQAGPNAAFERLIQKGAEGVIKKNNPLLLAYYIAPGDDEYNGRVVEALRYTIQHRPDQAADAYARWAHLIYWTFEDTAASMTKIRKAIEIDPNNATAYRVASYGWGDNPRREALLKKSLSLDSTSIFTWQDLGIYYMDNTPVREEKALACFAKCYEIDSTVSNAIGWWMRLLFRQGKYKEANEKAEKLHYQRGRDNVMTLAISIALNDSLEAARKYTELRSKTDPILFGESLNELAFELELRKQYDLSFELVRLALLSDSTSRKAAFSYSTLAELFALTGNKEAFYRNIEKAFKLDPSFPARVREFEGEPYTSLSKEPRFNRLIDRYSSQKKQRSMMKADSK